MPGTKTKKAPAAKKSADTKNAAAQSNTQLEKLFHESLKDIYWAEKHLVKELPKMKKASTTRELQDAIDEHTTQTEEHVTRLEQVFEIMGKKAQAKKCDGMEGLIKEGQSVIEETEDGTMTRDAGIIMSAQKVEHYEIASYGSLVALAATMGQSEIADILTTTLEEEKQTDKLLSGIAKNDINWEAEQEVEYEE